jgi:hypothetical protein
MENPHYDFEKKTFYNKKIWKITNGQ